MMHSFEILCSWKAILNHSNPFIQQTIEETQKYKEIQKILSVFFCDL